MANGCLLEQRNTLMYMMPSFIWSTTVDAMSVISMIGRDKLVNGKGAMLIKLAGLFSVVNVSENEKINSASMIRYLSELCWFPSAAISDYITWERIDSNSAKAVFSCNNESSLRAIHVY